MQRAANFSRPGKGFATDFDSALNFALAEHFSALRVMLVVREHPHDTPLRSLHRNMRRLDRHGRLCAWRGYRLAPRLSADRHSRHRRRLRREGQRPRHQLLGDSAFDKRLWHQFCEGAAAWHELSGGSRRSQSDESVDVGLPRLLIPAAPKTASGRPVWFGRSSLPAPKTSREIAARLP